MPGRIRGEVVIRSPTASEQLTRFVQLLARTRHVARDRFANSRVTELVAGESSWSKFRREKCEAHNVADSG